MSKNAKFLLKAMIPCLIFLAILAYTKYQRQEQKRQKQDELFNSLPTVNQQLLDSISTCKFDSLQKENLDNLIKQNDSTLQELNNIRHGLDSLKNTWENIGKIK